MTGVLMGAVLVSVSPCAAATLPPLAGPIRMGDYQQEWHPSNWLGGGFHYAPFQAANVERRGDDVVMRLTRSGEAELQRRADLARARGSVEVDVTLPRMRDGLIVAPLWQFHERSRSELDFEVLGVRGLTINVHHAGRELGSVYVLQGDLSRRRLRLRIDFDLPRYAAFYVDGALVKVVKPTDLPRGMTMPKDPMRTFVSLWGYPKHGGWGGMGSWRPPLAADPSIDMILHGFQAREEPAPPPR